MKPSEKKQTFNNDLRDKVWVGEIISTDDPIKHYRCKIKIFGLLDEIEDDHLPWIFPGNNLSFAGEEGGFGSGSYPKVGTVVKVKFPFGDIYSGEYYSIQNINESLMNEISEDYVNSNILAYDVDENLKLMYTQNQGLMFKLRDNFINIDKDDNIKIEDNSGNLIEILNSDGKITIKANTEIEVEAPKIKMGTAAIDAFIKGDTFGKIFDNHFHIGNLGAPTGTSKSSGFLTKPALSVKSFIE